MIRAASAVPPAPAGPAAAQTAPLRRRGTELPATGRRAMEAGGGSVPLPGCCAWQDG